MKDSEFLPMHPMQFLAKAFLAKGDFKILVLSVLQNRPMHGYEITKVIEEQSHGIYRPGPGAVYPALQALLRRGMVKVNERERRKVYQITPAGKRLLNERYAEVHRHIEAFKKSMGPERASLMDEMAKTGKLLAIASKTMTPEQSKKIKKIISEAREKILRTLAE
jgi:DNA-binding PadR family transcriptional regulator